MKGYCASRLNQLDMIGKPAPAIQGTDLSGKPVNLGAMKGQRGARRVLGELVRA